MFYFLFALNHTFFKLKDFSVYRELFLGQDTEAEQNFNTSPNVNVPSSCSK